MSIPLIILFLIIFVLLIIIIQYNTLTKLKLKVKQSKSGIDVYLKQRFDLIPNLVEVVKGYSKYEKELLENIAKLRSEYEINNDILVSEDLNNKINTLLAIVENYPNITASKQFLNLQQNLSKLESQLQAARRLYNIDVTNYNTKIQVIPYNIIASLFGFKEEHLFEIEENEKKNINIDLE